MFRKPKVKGATRRRTDGWDDNQDAEGSTTESIQKKVIASVKLCDDDDVDTLVSKPPALLSFDNDEGADADFVIKKNKKKVKELKRLQKLEEEAVNEAVKEEEDLQKENEKEKYKKKKDREKDRDKDRKESKTRYLDKYRDCSSKVKPPQPDSDEEAEHDSHAKFPGTFASIPDSRAVYEAKKRRERMRREGVDGVIPLDDDQKLVDKGARARLIREDENDDSDEEAPKFYSSKDLLRNEEERRREEQGHFLEQEQGDERDADEEADEWEKQQILKAVSRHTIGQIRADYDNSTRLYRQRLQESAIPEATDMDIDMDDIVENFRTRNIGPTSMGGHITVNDILSKLKSAVVDREERLNTRRYEVKKIEDTLEENKATIVKMESDIPLLANKYAMYQELRAYCRSLLDCLNEKVSEINELGDKRQALAKARVERLARRRRRDMRDAYSDCVTAAAGKNPSTTRTPDAMIRVAERDARRARRRREREGTLAGVSHEEGLSSDDDEPTSQQLADQQAAAEIDVALRMVFVDALDDYAHLRKVLDRMIDWFAVDTGEGNTDVDSKHEVVKGIIPLIIEKVVLPYLTDVVNVEWEPMSLKQSKRLGAVLSGLSDYPKLNLEDSKSFAALAVAVKAKITAAIDDDLFVPIYSKQSIKNPATGCAAFLDRQYWAAIKLIRGLKAFSSFLNPASRLELVLDGVINRVCVVALETGILDDLSCERKVRALLAEIPEEMIESAKPDSFRNLIRCLGKVLEEQKNAGRSYYREVRKYVEKLQKKTDE
uniref:GCFC domain-containing protein n=1 Tax=Angiostrongylus cantonensis TaxID=6313 RepID=A0A0K0CUU7_ANGCA